MKLFRSAFLLVPLLLGIAAHSQSALPNGEQVWIPAKDKALGGKIESINLDATLYKPDGPGPFPVLVFSHGFTGLFKNPPTYPEFASHLVARGIAVLVPARRGIRGSGGHANEPATCDLGENSHGVDHALEDLDAVFAYVSGSPRLDAKQVLLGGHSRGGMLSMVYASRRPDASIKGVINFVGIWNDDRCPEINDLLFTEAGRNLRAPTLWLYADGDRMIAGSSARRYAESFLRGGSRLTFRLYAHDFGNGHALLLKGEKYWLPDLDSFLARLGYTIKP